MAIKVIEIVKRRDGVTRAAFRAQYEAEYVAAVGAALPELRSYARHHVVVSQLPARWEPDFDVVATYAFGDGVAVGQVRAVLSGAAGGPVAELADGFLDRATQRLVRVDVCESEMLPCAAPVAKRTILFSARRDLLTPEQYREYYENGHAVLGRRMIPEFLRYVRNYVAEPLTPGWVPDFDSISEFSFGSGAVLTPNEKKYLTRDEEAFCDRSSFRSVEVAVEESAII